MLETLSGNLLVSFIGWALLHSLWQAPVFGIALWLALKGLRTASANTRYLLALLTLGLSFVVPIATAELRLDAFDLRPAARTSAVQPAKEWNGALPFDSTKHAVDWRPATATIATTDWPTFRDRALGTVSNLLPALVGFWLLGVCFYSTRLCRDWERVRFLKTRSSSGGNEHWQDRLNSLATRVRVSRPIRVLETALVEVPTVVGWLKPVVLVPTAAFACLSTEHLEAVLLHELAHIRRFDYPVNVLQSVVEALMFYHPAVNWISKVVRLEREQACDDLAIQATGDAIVYARALVETESLRTLKNTSLVMAVTGDSLSERVRRLVHTQQPERKLPLMFVFVVAAVASYGLIAAAKAVSSHDLILENAEAISHHIPLPSDDETVPAEAPQPKTANSSDVMQQWIARDDLNGENSQIRAAAIQALGNRSGSVIVMDPRTGALLTVVNQEAALRRSWNPASTIKLITSAAALQNNLVDPDEWIRASARAKPLDLASALAYSDNGYFLSLGSKIGSKVVIEVAQKFGFGERTGAPFANENSGFLPNIHSIDAGRLGAFGEGVQVTPMQLATFVAALGNGGQLLKPIRLDQEQAGPEIRRNVDLSQSVLDKLAAGMTGSVAYGTGKRAHDSSNVVAGKTGTCRLDGDESGLFISYAPADKPRVVVVVAIHGHSAMGATAAEVAGSIYKSISGLI